MSHLFFPENKVISGSKLGGSFEKISGNFRFELSQEQITERYNPNDLGFLNINNIIESYGFFSYQNFNPKGNWNFWRHEADITYSRIYQPNNFANFGTSWSMVYGTKSFHAFGLNAGAEPIETNDFYETRNFNQYYKYPKNYWFGGFFSSDYSRPFALDVRLQQRIFDEPGRYNSRIFISPRFRPNDRLFLVPEFTREENFNEIGYAISANGGASNDSIIMGRRDFDVHILALNGSYIFNNKMALNINLRHYWSTAVYDKLYNLNPNNGYLDEINFSEFEAPQEIAAENVSFNAFNIDLGFSWRFAPGSDINVVWKNVIFENGNPLERSYFKELDQTLNAPQINNFSVKILYFIDYLTLKNR